MRSRTKRIARAVATVAVAALAIVPASSATAAAPTCEPATRVIPATQGSWPRALSPAGHVVTGLYKSQPSISLETLHTPDGTTADLVDGDRPLTDTRDVNSRGVVVGTERIYPDLTTVLYQPWVFRNGRAQDLATPGRQGEAVRKDYWALAVNGRSAVVGFKTNRDRYDATDPAYVARPVLWPTPRSAPIKLPMPDGYYGDAGGSFIDFMGDGTITGIVRDRVERNYYLTRWATPTSDPVLQRLPDFWTPTAMSGQWILGSLDYPRDKVFVRSWTEAFVIDGPQPLWESDVSSNGTFTVSDYDETQTSTSYVGSPTGTVHELGPGVEVGDVAASLGGQVLLRRDNVSIEVVTCALALPEASGFTVTPLPLPLP